MRFDHVWMQPWQTEKLSQLAAVSCITGEVIEIGVYQGLSAIPIAEAIFPKTLHAVDHWKGSSDFTDDMRAVDNFDVFISNIIQAEKTNVTIHAQDWHEFASHWAAPIGFMHLDAEHTKSEVAEQIETFLPHMASGSVLAGDDYDWPTVREGITVHFNPGEVNVMGHKLWWVQFLWLL